jgi:hypothetical protein
MEQIEIRLIDFGLACPLSPEDLVFPKASHSSLANKDQEKK